jgi:hypothetical protein
MRTIIEEPTPLPVLADPAPVVGIDLDDTSQLWEIDNPMIATDPEG